MSANLASLANPLDDGAWDRLGDTSKEIGRAMRDLQRLGRARYAQAENCVTIAFMQFRTLLSSLRLLLSEVLHLTGTIAAATLSLLQQKISRLLAPVRTILAHSRLD